MATAKKDLLSKKRLFVKNGLRDAELNEVRKRLPCTDCFVAGDA